jgi:hypothetical protein
VEPQMQRESNDRLSVLGVVALCAMLGMVLAPVALGISVFQSGLTRESLVRAALGGGICWTAAVLALISTYLGNRWHSPVQGLLLGMLFRMALPLAAILVLTNLGGPLALPGIATTILGVYLVALALETLLAVRMISPVSGTRAKAA